MPELAQQVKEALEGADLEAYRELLAPDATWGPPDDYVSGCHNREQILEWYSLARDAGMRAEVTEVVPGEGTLLVGLRVTGNEAAAEQGGTAERWQVLTVRDGLVADIRGFEDRAVAASRAGLI